MTRRLRIVFALVLVLSLSAAGEASADTPYRLFHFNMCGQVEGGQCNGGTSRPVTYVRDQIETYKPYAVSLNEACKSQFDEIYWGLNSRALWSVHGHFTTTKSVSPADPTYADFNCRADGDGIKRFGNAIFVRQPIFGAPQEVELPHSTGGEIRKLTCLVTALAKGSVVCTTHITTRVPAEGSTLPVDYYKDAQIARVKEVVNTHVNNGTPLVLMGDFNVTPKNSTLDRIYDPVLYGGTAYGLFRELDDDYGTTGRCRCGAFTTDSETRKIDYIFVSRRDWTTTSGYPTATGYSDHHTFRGTATLITP
jgi:endonuclease/exonuclease/phosphatase family metal-dependent hydrolase